MDWKTNSIDVEPNGNAQPRLSIVVPVCGGSRPLARTLQRIASYLAPLPDAAEVIVVDDGNTDDTQQVVESLKERFKSLVIVTHKRRRGPGAAARSGVLIAKGHFVVLAETGFAAEASELDVLISSLASGADVAIASRKLDPRASDKHDTGAAARLAETAFTLASRLILPTGVRDLFSGLIAFRHRAVHLIASRSKVTHGAYVVEWMALAQYLGQQVIECPVRLARSAGGRPQRGLLELARIGDLWSIRRRLSGFEYSRPQAAVDLMHETSFVRIARECWAGVGGGAKG
jgi:glycosyltransferase involved in cell wall biosynthesis